MTVTQLSSLLSKSKGLQELAYLSDLDNYMHENISLKYIIMATAKFYTYTINYMI